MTPLSLLLSPPPPLDRQTVRCHECGQQWTVEGTRDDALRELHGHTRWRHTPGLWVREPVAA